MKSPARPLRAAALALSLAILAIGGDAFAKGHKSKSAPAATSRRPSELHVRDTLPDAAGSQAQSAASSSAAPSRGPTRIDFDDRLIQGQTNKSGAVYLYDRKELKTRSMVKKRESFRDQIVGSVYDG